MRFSELDLLRNAERVVDLDAEIADGAFELRVSELDLLRKSGEFPYER